MVRGLRVEFLPRSSKQAGCFSPCAYKVAACKHLDGAAIPQLPTHLQFQARHKGKTRRSTLHGVAWWVGERKVPKTGTMTIAQFSAQLLTLNAKQQQQLKILWGLSCLSSRKLPLLTALTTYPPRGFITCLITASLFNLFSATRGNFTPCTLGVQHLV